MRDTPGDRRNIVVGVDGSETSSEALRWAADEAALTGARLDVVAAWDYRLIYGGTGVKGTISGGTGLIVNAPDRSHGQGAVP